MMGRAGDSGAVSRRRRRPQRPPWPALAALVCTQLACLQGLPAQGGREGLLPPVRALLSRGASGPPPGESRPAASRARRMLSAPLQVSSHLCFPAVTGAPLPQGRLRRSPAGPGFCPGDGRREATVSGTPMYSVSRLSRGSGMLVRRPSSAPRTSVALLPVCP